MSEKEKASLIAVHGDGLDRVNFFFVFNRPLSACHWLFSRTYQIFSNVFFFFFHFVYYCYVFTDEPSGARKSCRICGVGEVCLRVWKIRGDRSRRSAAIGFSRRTRDLGALVRPPSNARASGGRHSDDDFRCAEERGMCSQPAAGKMETPQQYCLRWKYHHSNLQAMFSQLLERECFCDVTLACEGKTLKAHKVSFVMLE